MPKISLEVSESDLEFLRRLARRNNTSVSGALLMSAFGKARKMPVPMESLFNELVILAGAIRSLHAKVKPEIDPDTLADINHPLERVAELADMAWELIKSDKTPLAEPKDTKPVQLDLL